MHHVGHALLVLHVAGIILLTEVAIVQCYSNWHRVRARSVL